MRASPQGATVSLRAAIFSTSSMLLAIRLTGAGAGFLAQLFLARLLSPADLGTFFSATSLAAVLGVVTSLGYPDLVARFVSRYQERGRPAWTAAFIHRSWCDTLWMALAAGAIVLLAAMLWPDAPSEARIAFIIAGASVPFLAVFLINYAIALAHRSFMLAYGPENILRPIVFLTLLAALYAADAQPGLVLVISLFFGGTLCLGIGQYLLLRPRLPRSFPAAPRRLTGSWRREAAPLVAFSLYAALFSDLAIIVVSPLIASSDVAAFGLSLKLAMLVGFSVQVAHQVLLPDLADAHARRALHEVGERLRAASLLPIAFTLLATAAAASFGDHALALFHPDFAEAKWTLTILVGCQFLRAAAGPGATLLTVIGAQRLSATICVASALVLAVGSLLLAPWFGLIGAAFAVLVSWTFWLGANAVALKRLNGMRCDVLALSRMRGRPGDRRQADEAA